MRYLVGTVVYGGKINWQDTSNLAEQKHEYGLKISFPFYSNISQHDSVKIILSALKQNGVDWLTKRGNGWLFNSKLFKGYFQGYLDQDWLNGNIVPDFEIQYRQKEVFGELQDRTYCSFFITPEMVVEQMPKRIFLSHKGVDKPLVRKYKIALEAMGLAPWLDEEAMTAGLELERGILRGFEDSCAAIFFVTNDFKDDRYLASEINYAISQKRTKNERFSIVTLAFRDSRGAPSIPDLLKTYVWKEPASELDAITEILRALPIKVGENGWR